VDTHRFEPVIYQTTFGQHPPALRISSGDTVVTTTVDSGGCDRTGTQVAPPGNPQTGPFFIQGAEPGDTIAVALEQVRPNRASGHSSCIVAPHVVDPDYIPDMPKRVRAKWRLDLSAKLATLLEPEIGASNLTLPLAPMLGCLGGGTSTRSGHLNNHIKCIRGQHGLPGDRRGCRRVPASVRRRSPPLPRRWARHSGERGDHRLRSRGIDGYHFCRLRHQRKDHTMA
jgi:acetamidase/formamidase